MDGVVEPGKKEGVTSDDAEAPGTTDGQQEQAEHVSFPYNQVSSSQPELRTPSPGNAPT